ncbi:hypothetical protein F2P44_24015 [Massilia sp. CCM 8695]|uniref:Lipoprotein n=1 Tax=Massilia frigida TaxID=2609281 RepID=A0ABX0NA64_9BURK|nr:MULTISPECIES: hypothetical protein [Massilia]MDM5175726.1 hypothetical protein [Massilia sp. DJPM01]NHZ82322.1 hypothetical protein [Massilia frigida]
MLALVACGKSAVAENPLEAAARRTCMDTIEARATNSKSISYVSDAPSPVTHGANGQLEVTLKFSAKNEMNIASTLQARCLVSADGKTLAEISVKDSR